MLEFRNVSKVFVGPGGPVDVLRSICFSIVPGELVAIAGPSGCGKTTLLLTAGGLLRPGEGKVFVDGTDLYSLTANQRSCIRAGKMGFVFQQFHLVSYLTVLENVFVSSVARFREDAHSRARFLVDRFGLGDREDHLPSQLSTGERQRTALARALFGEPRLILADEPTGNLDEANGRVVLEFLSEFAAAGGAVLLVTHDPQIARFAHRSIRLYKGTIVA